MTTATLESRVTELEIKLTYQDALIETLNQVVIELRNEVEATARRLAKVEQQIQLGLPDETPDEPPPHY